MSKLTETQLKDLAAHANTGFTLFVDAVRKLRAEGVKIQVYEFSMGTQIGDMIERLLDGHVEDDIPPVDCELQVTKKLN